MFCFWRALDIQADWRVQFLGEERYTHIHTHTRVCVYVCVLPITFCVAQRDSSNKTVSWSFVLQLKYCICQKTKPLKGCKSCPHKNLYIIKLYGNSLTHKNIEAIFICKSNFSTCCCVRQKIIGRICEIKPLATRWHSLPANKPKPLAGIWDSLTACSHLVCMFPT